MTSGHFLAQCPLLPNRDSGRLAQTAITLLNASAFFDARRDGRLFYVLFLFLVLLVVLLTIVTFTHDLASSEITLRASL
jgi:hypothetical protein